MDVQRVGEREVICELETRTSDLAAMTRGTGRTHLVAEILERRNARAIEDDIHRSGAGREERAFDQQWRGASCDGPQRREVEARLRLSPNHQL